MTNLDKFEGSAQITSEGIKKHFKSIEPVQAIFELVWNSLDANCSSVRVSVDWNDLGGLERVQVVDDGDGVNVQNIDNNFAKFNESNKKTDHDKHGSHGRGRLAFHKLSERAIWYTRRDDYDAKILVNSGALELFAGEYLAANDQHASLQDCQSGTCVELVNFGLNNLPTEKTLLDKLSKEFGWYLALNKEKQVTINGKAVTIPDHELHELNFTVQSIPFSVSVIRWEDKPSSEKSYNYLINSDSKIVKKELSKLNKKVTFHTSAYVSSSWIDDYDPEALELSDASLRADKIVKDVFAEVVSYQREIYSNYLRKYVDSKIEEYDKNGYFPKYKNLEPNYARWRKSNTKAILKDIYIADPSIFNNLKIKPAKILIRLLDKVLVSNENDSLFDVLDGVLELDDDNLSLLATQLEQTNLENVISTIESLQKRELAVHQLREVMNNRFSEVLETPDLQQIIENNTWLFGSQYETIGAEEDSFTKVALNLREHLNGLNEIDESEVTDGASVDGVNRQVDLFLARKRPTFDASGKEVFKCVIVEIKRPGISLNKKHLAQLDDYAEIVSKHPEFNSQKMVFDLILIGRKISKDDVQIRQRMANLKDKSEYGLVSQGDRMKCYVKDWFTIFDEFALSNHYLLEKLNTKLGDLSVEETSELVAELQSSNG